MANIFKRVSKGEQVEPKIVMNCLTELELGLKESYKKVNAERRYKPLPIHMCTIKQLENYYQPSMEKLRFVSSLFFLRNKTLENRVDVAGNTHIVQTINNYLN